MSEIKLIVYRHKERKDIYLKRNWSVCGGGATTEFYTSTKDISDAIRSVRLEKDMGTNFDSWFHSFLDKNGQTKLVVKIQDKKDFEFDGYKGMATKEITLRVADFERVELVEKEGESNGRK